MMNSTAVRTLAQLDVHVLEDARGDALALADEAEEQMLRADVVVVEPLRLVLRQRQDLARAIRELVEAVHICGHASTVPCQGLGARPAGDHDDPPGDRRVDLMCGPMGSALGVGLHGLPRRSPRLGSLFPRPPGLVGGDRLDDLLDRVDGLGFLGGFASAATVSTISSIASAAAAILGLGRDDLVDEEAETAFRSSAVTRLSSAG